MSASGRPVRIAHVVETIVDRSHAPTALLATLVRHHDRSRFDAGVVVSHALPPLRYEWPLPIDPSDPRRIARSNDARQSGRLTMARLAASGITTTTHAPADSIEAGARRLAAELDGQRVDVAVFHGDAVLHILAANACAVPLTVLFDHGQIPSDPGFDLVIAATHEAAERARRPLEERGTRVVAVEMVVDVTRGNPVVALDRATLGASDQNLILTTVSNFLERRASSDFVAAVAAVLDRFPDALYLPVGPVEDVHGYVARFAHRGVGERVRPLGSRADVLRVLATADLYLNEFPFGGGVAALEAMAAGCPVVTMYDLRGETQGWAAAMYFGIDRAVRSCDPHEYVELACRLLTDGALRREWSRYATQRYQERTDAVAYVRSIESAILDAFDERPRTQLTTQGVVLL